MPRVKPVRTSTATLNSMAAHGDLVKVSGSIESSANIMKEHIVQLEQELSEVTDELVSHRKDHERLISEKDNKYERDTAELKNKLSIAEGKLRKIQGELA